MGGRVGGAGAGKHAMVMCLREHALLPRLHAVMERTAPAWLHVVAGRLSKTQAFLGSWHCSLTLL